MSYELKVFNHDDREAFRAAFASLSHTSGPSDQRRREWWCFDNPNGGAFALFKSGDEIAATCYLGGKKLLIGGRETPCFEIGETATEPAHQRKGLFSKLVKAVTRHASEREAHHVYGTPNSQSTPGYAKLDFTIVESTSSWLFVVTSLSHWLPFRLPRLPSLTGRGGVTELSLKDYVRATSTFERLNVSSPEYLDWRFGQSPAVYRFFKIATANGDFLCAVKEATLGKYASIVVSEYYLGEAKPTLPSAAKLLRKAIWTHYDSRRYLGLYVHGSVPGAWEGLLLKVKAVLQHRQLPICAMPTSREAMPLDWFKNFQLSDCDIG
jgi:GNAT superfamily N-acetyltransferase